MPTKTEAPKPEPMETESTPVEGKTEQKQPKGPTKDAKPEQKASLRHGLPNPKGRF